MKNDFLWVERYRPTIVEDCILPDSIKNVFQGFVSQQEIAGSCTGDYSLDIKIENIRLLPGDYSVKVSKNLISEWNNTTLDLTYYIALEP